MSTPTIQPSEAPSGQPSAQPIGLPSSQPSSYPTRLPTCQPFSSPSMQPTRQPLMHPSSQPTSVPSNRDNVWIVRVDNTSEYIIPSSMYVINNYCIAEHWTHSAQHTGQCNLYSAWLFCLYRVPWSLGRVDECLIQLPNYSSLNFSSTTLTADLTQIGTADIIKITIDGNASTIILKQSTSLLATTNPLGYQHALLSLSLINMTIQRSLYGTGIIETRVDSMIDLFQIHTFIVSQVVLTGLPTSVADGGAIRLANASVVSISNCVFEDHAALNGGAVSIQSVKSVSIIGSAFHNNIANVIGGAILVDRALSVDLVNCHFNQSRAKNFGGAISLNAVTVSVTIESSSFVSNMAKYGSAVIMGHCSGANIVDSNIFIGNYALYGGMVYLIASSGTSPVQRISTNIIDTSNICAGEQGCGFVTEPSTLFVTPSNLMITSYETGSFPLHSSIVLADQYGHRVTDSSRSGFVDVLIASHLNDVSCGINDGQAQLLGTLSGVIENGAVNITQYNALCIPGGKLNITYRTTIKTWTPSFPDYRGVVIHATHTVTITQKVPLVLRRCERGEVFVIDSAARARCVRCENGVSLQDNSDNSITSCSPCPAGARDCQSDTVMLIPNT